MNSKILKMPNIFSLLVYLETKNDDQIFEVASLDQIA